MSLKEKLLKASELRTGEVLVEGEQVRVRELTTPEFAEYGRLTQDQRDEKGNLVSKGDRLKAIAYLISTTVLDESGAPVFTPEEALHVAKSPRVSLPIMGRVMELSGVREGDEKHSLAS